MTISFLSRRTILAAISGRESRSGKEVVAAIQKKDDVALGLGEEISIWESGFFFSVLEC